MKRPTNIQVARDLAAYNSESFDENDRLDYPATDWVAEDSDFPRRYWRIGGNAVVYQSVLGLEACRWHEFVKSTKYLRYPAR